MIEYLQGQRPEPSLYSPPCGPLVTPRDILTLNPASEVGAYDAEALRGLTVMARYVVEFLTSGHPELGRAGAVCPFAAKALDQHLIRLTAFPLAEPDEAAVAAGMEALRGELDRLGTGGGDETLPRHRAIVAVFPRLSEQAGSAMVARVQKALKPAFIARGLMIGQFYPGCPEPGLWNPDFRPLQTPVVSLAIRDITILDAPFMLERQTYVDAFVRVFGRAGEERIAKARGDRRRSGRRPKPAPAAEARP
jgi:hypothetical protein